MPEKNKDIVERNLIGYPDVFASIVNAFFKINGCEKEAEKVKPEDLEDVRGWSFYKVSNKLREQERDSVKLWKKGELTICLIGIENQTGVDYDMPLRIFGYEGADYRNQLENRKKEGKKKNKIHPVITIVLYYGIKKRWTASKTLFEKLKLPDWLKPFVNDCHVNVLELSWLTEEQEKFFCNDMRVVINYLRQIRENQNYVPEPIVLEHYQAVLNWFQSFTNDRRFEKAVLTAMNMETRGEKIMLPSFLEIAEKRVRAEERAKLPGIRAEAEEKGRAEERAKLQGILAETEKKVRSERDVIRKRLLATGMSPEEVASIIDVNS